MKLIGFFWGLISLVSTSALANNPNNPNQTNGERYQDNSTFEVTVTGTINGVKQVRCLTYCVVYPMFPGGRSNVCDGGTGACTVVYGPLRTSGGSTSGGGTGNGNGNSGNGNSGNGNSGNSNTGNGGSSAP